MKTLLTISILFLALSCKAQEPDVECYSQAKWDSLLTVNTQLNDSIASLNLIVIKDSVSIFVKDINLRLFDSEIVIDIDKRGQYINVKTSKKE